MINVIVGPPCAGKSTYVRENALPGDVIVDFDAIATALGAHGRMPEGALKEVTFAARTAVIDQLLEGVAADSWIIHTNPGRPMVDRYRNAGAEFVVLDPGIEVCEERAAADGRPGGTIEIIRQWYESPPDLGEVSCPSSDGFFHALKEGAIMETKSFSMKASPVGDEKHTFEGYASTWTKTPDSYGDIVIKGAFTDSLERWEQSGKTMPVLWSHNYDSPDGFVARVVEVVEDDHGLRVKGKFFEDDAASMKVWRLLKEGIISEMSFAFTIDESAIVDVDGEQVRELRRLNLMEVSVVMWGANSDTSIEAVKKHTHFSANEIAALKETAAQKFASEEEEVARKSGVDEAALRVKERINALIGAETEDSK